jgi:hypothetical protein
MSLMLRQNKLERLYQARLFQTILTFMSKAGPCLSGSPFRCTPLGQALGLTRKYRTKLERHPEAVFLVVCDPPMNEL